MEYIDVKYYFGLSVVEKMDELGCEDEAMCIALVAEELVIALNNNGSDVSYADVQMKVRESYDLYQADYGEG
jgi:hypothetical protein